MTKFKLYITATVAILLFEFGYVHEYIISSIAACKYSAAYQTVTSGYVSPKGLHHFEIQQPVLEVVKSPEGLHRFEGPQPVLDGVKSPEGLHQNWTILLIVNDGYFDFFQNWLWYFKKLHLDIPITVIAEDDVVHRKLELLNFTITVLRSKHVSIASAVDINRRLFRKLVSTRPIHVYELLQEGTDVLYADIDSVWLRDPFPFFVGNYDAWIQYEIATKKHCTGFLAFKNNINTTLLVRTWKEDLQAKPNLDQRSFNRIVRQSSNIRIKSLNSKEFPSGHEYFRTLDANQRSQAVVVHNNWIVGHNNKLERFKKFNLWHVNVSSRA